MTAEHASLFSYYGHILSVDPQKNFPLQHHPQISWIVDTLNRQSSHHVVIEGSLSETINKSFADSIAMHFATNSIAKKFQASRIIYLDVASLYCKEEKEEWISESFYPLETKQELTVLIINSLEPLLSLDKNTLGYLGNTLRYLLNSEAWRFIFLTPTRKTLPLALTSFFSVASFQEPTEAEKLAIIHSHQAALENAHDVMITDDVFSYAYSLSQHYLGGAHALDTTLTLLDSAAARASLQEQHDTSGHKPLVTTTLVAHLVSSWTNIPLANLHHNKFKATALTQALHSSIVGQESAIQQIATLLQQACIPLQETHKPLATFLWVGAEGTGKKTFAKALAHYLFGSENALYRISLKRMHTLHSLDDLPVISGNSTRSPLTFFEAITQTPYAIFLFENVTTECRSSLDLLASLLEEGNAFHKGQRYDFSHAIFIFTTSCEAEHINAFSQRESAVAQATNLMQLVLSEQLNEPSSQKEESIDELKKIIFSALTAHFSKEFLQHTAIIPFMPLERSALEKIIRTQLHALTERLNTHFDVELSIAPEITTFLLNEISHRQNNAASIQTFIEHHIHSAITHKILSPLNEKQRAKRLVLRLNDTGKIVQCEFFTTQGIKGVRLD
jgi:ATP-dependent Clp protease ATP-binding subunit ClpA